GFDILQSERELIGIDALGPAAKPRALKMLDDQLEPLDLVVAVLDNRYYVAHETMQQSRIGWKIIEIELHNESYANALIRSSNFPIFHAGFRIFQPASDGFHVRSGVRQSMPSISIASCAGVSVTVPPGSHSEGQMKWPCCRRLVKRHSPLPSQN